MLRISALLAFLSFVFGPPPALGGPLDPNDVSILMPLPVSAAADFLLRPDHRGGSGQLLPEVLFQALPTLAHYPLSVTYAKLRVVGIRLDPCFDSGDGRCQPQIRAVWQPVEPLPEGGLTTLDAAVHTFYDLTPSEFAATLKAFEDLKLEMGYPFRGALLGPHPGLREHGLSSEYGRKFFRILTERLGVSRMSQLTFMTLGPAQDAWTFGAFKVAHGAATPTVIPRTGSTTQMFVNQAGPARAFRGGFTPEPFGPDRFDPWTLDSNDVEPNRRAEITQAYVASVRLENPDLHSSVTADCASCHAAQAFRTWAERSFPAWNLRDAGRPYVFRTGLSVENPSPHPDRTDRMRAFGYHGREPSIAQRTIHETARVLERLAQFATRDFFALPVPGSPR